MSIMVVLLGVAVAAGDGEGGIRSSVAEELVAVAVVASRWAMIRRYSWYCTVSRWHARFCATMGSTSRSSCRLFRPCGGGGGGTGHTHKCEGYEREGGGRDGHG